MCAHRARGLPLPLFTELPRRLVFSETEELLFALPSPLIYYPLNEQPMRFRIRYLGKD